MQIYSQCLILGGLHAQMQFVAMIELYNLCYLHVHCITCIIILFNKSFWTVISRTKSQNSHIHGENEECQMMRNVFVHILTPQLLKSIDKWQRYSHFVAFWTDFRHLSLYHKITGWTQLKCKQHKKPWGRRIVSHQTVSASHPRWTNSLGNTTKWTLFWLAQPFLNTSSRKWSNLVVPVVKVLFSSISMIPHEYVINN